ncbi:hypothetical protein [Parapedobacter sp. SGR-10]|nr:hypothetical protein [Parapedobacter sp. SGR-10]
MCETLAVARLVPIPICTVLPSIRQHFRIAVRSPLPSPDSRSQSVSSS